MADTAPSFRAGRWAILLLVAVLIVIGIWSGGWVYVRSEASTRIDTELARLKDRGVAVTCNDRAISGWPFRFDIDCRAPSVEIANPSAHVATAALRVAALVYQPDRIVVEADGPLTAEGPRAEVLKASWQLLQASVGLSGLRPDRISVASDALSASITPAGGLEGRLNADHAEVHLRRASDAAADSNDFDVFTRLDGIALFRADKPIGPAGSNLALNAVARRVPLVRTPDVPPLKAWADGGGTLDVRSARWSIGGFTVDASGTLAADADGQLSGSLKLVASGAESLLIGAATMKNKAELLAVASAFTLLGKPADGPTGRGRTLEVAVDKGVVRVGSTTLAHLPRLF